MADLGSLTTFPGETDYSASTTQFCRLEVVMPDLDGEDSDVTVEDINPPSMFARYQTPRVAEEEEEEEEDDEDGMSCVALTFYTDSGEVSRYITDSQSDDVYQVFARVLAVLGQKGWRAINLVVDRQYEETWFLQRVV